jgi:cytidylate kinase
MPKKSFIVIALDGGAATGKSSTSKILAKHLNLLHVDTGAHYRTISFILLKNNIYPSDVESVVNKLTVFKIESKIEDRDAQMTINGLLPSHNDLRSPLVNRHVSPFSAIPELRHFLLDYQRSQIGFAAKHGFNGLVMDGRDIGSVVLPEADFKFFLDADPHTRHARRALQGHEDSVADRDHFDSSRATAPLVCAPGAIRIDTSHSSLNEVAAHILDIILKKY